MTNPSGDGGRKEGAMAGGAAFIDWHTNPMPPMSKKRRQQVISNMLRRPYYGTRQDKELKDAKDRARADR